MGREYLKEATDASLEIPQDVTESVREIVDTVRAEGDNGIRELTRKFDDVDRQELRVSDDEIQAAAEKLSQVERETIENTVENVREFHEAQFEHLDGFEAAFDEGITLGTRLVPVERAGVYVPGGRKPLVAAPAMTIVPAVDKVTGPGNVYVIEAKRQVYGHVGIDFLAGPTEVLIVADETADPEMVATDLLAQAEHDPRSRAALVSTDRETATATVEELHDQVSALRTEDVATESWEENGEVVLVDTLAEAVTVANEWAPEHLQVMTAEPRELLGDLRNYGSTFLGHHAPVVFGDKAVGTNHTLPTLEVARYSGGINVTTYLKVLTHQELTAAGADTIAPWAAKICEMEGTHAHQISAEKRIISPEGRDQARSLELESGGGVDLSEE